MRRTFGVLAALGLMIPGLANAEPPQAKATLPAKIAVVVDTDIGNDIDDTWALGLLLKSPEFDVKLIVGDRGRPIYRAKLLAKFLERAGRTEIPIGVGLDVAPKGEGPQAEWVKGYELKSYPGKVHEDGVGALVDTIMKSDRPMTLLCLGPLPNIAEALRREPRIAERARFVGMYGSVRVGYGGARQVSAEANVRNDVTACQRVFSAPWDMTITPLDTCGLVQLKGAKYRAICDSKDPIAVAIIENYDLWAACHQKKGQPKQIPTQSSILFDTVAIYLAYGQDLCTMETIPLRVTDDGFTRIDPNGKPIHVAAAWKDLSAFEDLLVQRLTRP